MDVDAIEVIDSHTEGEPTRVIVDGWPPIEGDTMAERRRAATANWDHLRRAVLSEPRGHGALVGVLLTAPVSADSDFGILFLNDVGFFGMSGHAIIGAIKTLSTLNRISPGPVRIDTLVGTVTAELHEDASVTIEGIPCCAETLDVPLHVPELGMISGDIAFGGNWFFITSLASEPVSIERVTRLAQIAARIRLELHRQCIRSRSNAHIESILITAPPSRADAKNFVLCCGNAYDRSPCGSGTAALLATLHARGRIALGQTWRQESVTGTVFTAWLSEENGNLACGIRGRAFITGRGTLHLDPNDPFRYGLPS